MKKSQVKSIVIVALLTILFISLAYALSSTLLSPADDAQDNDGYLDLRGSCEPTSQNEFDGTTEFNITNATLYTDISGTWKANETLPVASSARNETYYFNFTSTNQTAEGTYRWNIECNQQNTSDITKIDKLFSTNRTIIVKYSTPSVTVDLADGTYILDGGPTAIQCVANPTGGWNISQIDLKTNSDALNTWEPDSSHVVETRAVGTQVTANFLFNDTAKIKRVLFSCSATQFINNPSGGFTTDSEKSTTNRTLILQSPPNVSIISPTDNNWSKFQRNRLSWTVVSQSTNETVASPFKTRVWTNETGDWLPRTGLINVINNTPINFSYIFPEQSAIVWGIQGFFGTNSNVFNFSANRTINIDETNPTASISSPTDGSIINGTVIITFTATDTNLNSIQLFFGLGAANFTNTSYVSGTTVTHTINSSKYSINEGNFNISLLVDDNSGRTFQTSNITITVDNTAPGITGVANLSIDQACDKRKINWTANETVNFTFFIDTDTDVSDGIIFTNTTFSTNHSVSFDFDYNAEILHYFNISVCDQAGNCNSPTSQRQFMTPARVCTGWSQYAIYDDDINLSDLQNQTGADLVYVWNATNQNWVFFAAGLSSNGWVDVGKLTNMHVVHLFENTNSTWFRNIVNPGFYDYNVTSVNNFISVPIAYTFGNLTESFMNESKDFPVIINRSATDNIEFGPFNITAFAGYNNSAQNYVNHIYNFTWRNDTILEPAPNRNFPATIMETFWVASNFNITWNGTQAVRNWTI